MAEDPKEPSGVDVLTELGVSGLRHDFGKVREEWMPELFWDNKIKAYVEMRDSPALGVALLVMETLIRKTPMQVTPADLNRPSSLQCAERFDASLHDMEGTFQEHWTEALTCLWGGHAPFEEVWKRCLGPTPGVDEDGNPLPPSKFSDNAMTLHRLAFRSQESVDRWQFEKDGTYSGFWQVDPNGYEQTFIPITKCLHYRIRAHKNNPEGTSLLRIAYIPYTFCKRLQVVEAVGFERNAYGVPIFYFPLSYLLTDATAEQKRVVAQAYQQGRGLRRDVNEAIVAPAPKDAKGDTGFGIDSFKGGGSERNMGVREAIKDYRKDMLTALVCEMLAMGMDRVGTLNASDSKKDTLGMVLEAILDSMLDTFNAGPPKKFAAFNGYAPEDAPQLTRSKIVTPSMAEMGAFFAPLIQAGMPTDEGLWAFLRTAGGAPAPDLAGNPDT